MDQITTIETKKSPAEGPLKRILIAVKCAAIFLAISGCATNINTNTKAPNILEGAVPKLDIKRPVAFRNVALNTGEIETGKVGHITFYADLHNYTASSIAAAKNVLKRQNIQVMDDADKVLDLSVYKATVKHPGRATTTLRVRTGSGLSKEYQASQGFFIIYRATSAMELALARCVEQMFNDKEILQYLRN